MFKYKLKDCEKNNGIDVHCINGFILYKNPENLNQWVYSEKKIDKLKLFEDIIDCVEYNHLKEIKRIQDEKLRNEQFKKKQREEQEKRNLNNLEYVKYQEIAQNSSENKEKLSKEELIELILNSSLIGYNRKELSKKGKKELFDISKETKK